MCTTDLYLYWNTKRPHYDVPIVSTTLILRKPYQWKEIWEFSYFGLPMLSSIFWRSSKSCLLCSSLCWWTLPPPPCPSCSCLARPALKKSLSGQNISATARGDWKACAACISTVLYSFINGRMSSLYRSFNCLRDSLYSSLFILFTFILLSWCSMNSPTAASTIVVDPSGVTMHWFETTKHLNVFVPLVQFYNFLIFHLFSKYLFSGSPVGHKGSNQDSLFQSSQFRQRNILDF